MMVRNEKRKGDKARRTPKKRKESKEKQGKDS